MAEAERSIEVNVEPKDLYKIIVDFERYSEFIPEMKRVTILSKSKNRVEAEFEVNLIKTVRYTLILDLKPHREVSWTLKEKGFLKVNDGRWTLEPIDKGKRTRATYWVRMDMGLVPSAVLKPLLQVNFPRMLGQFKKRAESLARG
jgi:ribosome-associated toxin RatA of RatAB toxin-antitoxin module